MTTAEINAQFDQFEACNSFWEQEIEKVYVAASKGRKPSTKRLAEMNMRHSQLCREYFRFKERLNK